MLAYLIRKLYLQLPKRLFRILLASVLLGSIFLLVVPIGAQTQSKIPSYWQYAASGRLLHLQTADVDLDGVDEFVIADENGRVDMIDASGEQRWTYTAPANILTLQAINIDGPVEPKLEIVLGLPNQMILLSANGEEIWRTRVAPEVTSPTPLTGGARETAGAWIDEENFLPVALAPFDRDGNGQDEILALLQSGYILLFDAEGNLVWQNTAYAANPSDIEPQLLVTDLDLDGQQEVVFSVFNPRRFGQLVLIDDGAVEWEIPLSGRITDLTSIRFHDGSTPLVAASTSLGQVHLFDHSRRQHWFRTLNRPASSLAVFPLTKGDNALAVGTRVGSVVAFDEYGRRLWESKLVENADREILAISASSLPPAAGQPLLAVTLEAENRVANAADVILLGSSGQTLTEITDVDSRGITRFNDSNHDLNDELIIGHFATLELLGIGAGDSENIREWEYTLDAAPTAALAVDLDGDEEEELIIGTEDGRIHSLNSDRTIRWLHDTGGAISQLAIFPSNYPGDDNILVVRYDNESAIDGSAWIELREAKGEKIWELQLDSTVTALLVANLDESPTPEIIVGTRDDRILVFDADGEKQAEVRVNSLRGGVQKLLAIERNEWPLPELIAAGETKLVGINLQDELQPVRDIAAFDNPIIDVFGLADDRGSELSVRLLVTTGDGQVHGLNLLGIEMSNLTWPLTLQGTPTAAIGSSQMNAAQQQLLVSTDQGELVQVDVMDDTPDVAWHFEDVGIITALEWRDEDGDGMPDVAVVGNEQGQVRVYSQLQSGAPQSAFAPLELNSAIYALVMIKAELNQSPMLLVVTENGLVQMFREQENRPPLLTEPVAESDQGRYSIGITVQDVEGDEVSVQLQIENPETGQWLEDETQVVSSGRGTIFWQLTELPDSPDGLRYRFQYDDGSYEGVFAPPPGPPAISPSRWVSAAPALLLTITGAGLLLSILFVRQSQTPHAQSGRFYRRLRQQPEKTLILLERKYAQTEGSPDFLLHLASRTRQSDDRLITNLADGLFLLPERPQAGLSILDRTLEKMEGDDTHSWEGLERWRVTYGTLQLLLEAPTVTELSLLRPQLLQLLHWLESNECWSPVLNVLRPIITNIHDSERVDLVEDRLVYLNEAASRLMQTREWLPDYSPSIENTVVAAIIHRWSGIVTAEIEDLRGRAQLSVVLKTKRLVPSPETIVALEIHNSGRAAAENILAELENDPAYMVQSAPQEVSFLPPGRTKEVRFVVMPQVVDRFRISLSLTYDDRSHQNMTIAFGDMVYLLPPVRDYVPIVNPYVPGTPLRPGSMLFFGREDLFTFIAENAGFRSFRNVIILVGQRRTGKTSALLRLENQLPAHLLPVYIDCQSLGVTPGMPALLEELAWYIADALARRDIHVEVPGLDKWQKDPTRLFQRKFLTEAKELLPPDTTLLLVFDEFEAFENLVADGILPSTFFTYLRHLMQHGDQLNFIFVGTRRLEEMTSDYWSVLFNIALYRKIDFLTPEAATRLITEPVAPELVYDDLAIDKILRVTAGHPYFLQLVCYTLVKRANSERTGYVTISDVNAAVDEMMSLGEVHFAYLWRRSSPAERALLVAMAHLMDRNAPFFPEDLVQYLKPYAVHLDPKAVTAALNKLVERDILREVTEEARTLYELKLGLVGLWVAKNKSISKLHASNGSKEVKEISLEQT